MSSATEGTGYRLGYARVSTHEQDPALQHGALVAAGCQRIFVDKASGKLESRPAFDDLLEQVRPGDTLVVWRLDRLGRSLRHLLETVARPGAPGGGLHQSDREHRHEHPLRAAGSTCSGPWRSSSGT